MSCGAPDGHCITCGDDGIGMRVVTADARTAICSDGDGERHEVAVELVGTLEPGDELLVHAGVAIRKLDASLPEAA